MKGIKAGFVCVYVEKGNNLHSYFLNSKSFSFNQDFN